MKKLIILGSIALSLASCGLHNVNLYHVHTATIWPARPVYTTIYSRQDVQVGQYFVENGVQYVMDRVEGCYLANENNKIVY